MAVVTPSAGVYKFTTADDTATGVLLIRRIEWVGATNVADDLTIEDAAGNVHFAAKAVESGTTICKRMVWDFNARPYRMTGMKVEDLDAGTLYVYVV